MNMYLLLILKLINVKFKIIDIKTAVNKLLPNILRVTQRVCVCVCVCVCDPEASSFHKKGLI